MRVGCTQYDKDVWATAYGSGGVKLIQARQDRTGEPNEKEKEAQAFDSVGDGPIKIAHAVLTTMSGPIHRPSLGRLT